MISRSLFTESKKLRIFDFDDTLVRTNSYIYVTHANGKTTKMSPGEYAVYKPRKGDEFDYSDFQRVQDPTEIRSITKILRRMIKASGDRDVYILTARAAMKPIAKYLKEIGIRDVKIVALADSNPKKKADWIEKKVREEDFTDVYFIDDSEKNIRAVDRKLHKMDVNYRVSLMKPHYE